MKNRTQINSGKAVFKNIDGFLGGENALPSYTYKLLMHEDNLHFHKVIEIGYCKRGRGKSITGGLAQTFGAGDIQIVFPFQPHMNMSEKEGESEECIWTWSFFDPILLAKSVGANTFALTKIMERINVYGIIKKEEFPRIYSGLYDLIGEVCGGKGDYHLEKVFAKLTLALIDMAENEGSENAKVKIPEHFHLIADSLIEVNNRIASGEQPTVGELADICKMPLSSFRRTFGEVMGVSPKKHIINCAVQNSTSLISMTDKSIAEIAGDCGFSEISTFNRAFKGLMGMSPNEYRQLKRRGI